MDKGVLPALHVRPCSSPHSQTSFCLAGDFGDFDVVDTACTVHLFPTLLLRQTQDRCARVLQPKLVHSDQYFSELHREVGGMMLDPSWLFERH